MTNIIKRLLSKKYRKSQQNSESASISINQVISQSTLPTNEKKMFLNLLDIKDILVEDIMIPRSEVVSINDNADFLSVINKFKGQNYKQILVYKKNLDNIIGYIMLKDVIEFASKPKTFAIKNILKEVSFISPTMKCFETLCHMQQSHKTFLVVVDEFGGVNGVISIENIVSKLFGDIKDYSFEKISYIEKIDDLHFVIDARISIEDFENKTNLKLLTNTDEEIDVVTVGGLVASIMGKLPTLGEKICYPGTNICFKILDVSPRKINKMEVSVNKK